MAFIRKIEDFICENCGEEVKGNGFTNHCPKCLYSTHVDNEPGDRLNDCRGLMEPIGAKENGGEWSLIHKCTKCGKIQKNKISKEDDFEKVIEISTKHS